MKLKITKFGFIHKDETGNIVLSDFELEKDGDIDARNIYIDVIDALIEEFKLAKKEHLEEVEG